LNYILKEGYSVISKFLFLTLVLLIVGFYTNLSFLIGLSILSFIVALFSCFFFRNPRRIVTSTNADILAPADGKIMSIENEYYEDLGKVKVVRIFLSIFNVHIQRAPIEGVIDNIVYTEGKFLPAMDERAHIENEKNSIDFIKEDGRKVRCVQIAGIIARRIVVWKSNGDCLKCGDLYGIIKFGSQVDIYIPQDAKILVRPKQKIQAGITKLARWSYIK